MEKKKKVKLKKKVLKRKDFEVLKKLDERLLDNALTLDMVQDTLKWHRELLAEIFKHYEKR